MNYAMPRRCTPFPTLPFHPSAPTKNLNQPPVSIPDARKSGPPHLARLKTELLLQQGLERNNLAPQNMALSSVVMRDFFPNPYRPPLFQPFLSHQWTGCPIATSLTKASRTELHVGLTRL